MDAPNTSQTAHFDSLASQWWDESGAFGVLHSMNPLRIRFIKDLCLEYFPSNSFKDLTILDIGCGGGIVCEPLTRLGAKVVGVDASPAAIISAKDHALSQNLEIDYQCIDVKDIDQTFDLVSCFEVIEHVDDIPLFAKDIAQKLNQGGLLVLSTLNKTWFSYLVGILGAEYLTRKVPVGTHDWHKFIEPAQLVTIMEEVGLQAISLKGLNYSVLKNEWYLGGHLKMNYIAGFFKK